MTAAPRTTLQIVINALFVLSYTSVPGFFVFAMAHVVTHQSLNYFPALTVLVATMSVLGDLNEQLSPKRPINQPTNSVTDEIR